MEEIWCENYNYRVVVNSEPSLAKHRVNITQCKHEKFGVKIAFTFLSYIIKFCFVFITIDQIKALNFYFYIKTTFRSLLHLQVKDYTNFE